MKIFLKNNMHILRAMLISFNFDFLLAEHLASNWDEADHDLQNFNLSLCQHIALNNIMETLF